MPIIDNEKAIIPLSGVAEMLQTKSRTLRMYEERGLLPKHEGVEKKLYSINDMQSIAFVHYLASLKKVNASGIKYILELVETHIDANQREEIMRKIEKELGSVELKELEEINTL